MRIISGKFKGRRIEARLKKCTTRPTMDMAKEGLFNIINNLYDFQDIKTLDLFGGTGSISIEFISRGVIDATLVDKDYNCIEFIKKIKEELRINTELKLIKSDVFKFLNYTSEKYDVIFADPPYDFNKIEEIIEAIFTNDILSSEGIFILEHDAKNNFSEHPRFKDIRSYGTNKFSFFE